jgi:hypothetical protein
MPGEEHRSTGLILLGLSLFVMIAGLLVRALPLKVAILLTAWALVSLPLGIAVGHCVLSED